jgi:nucleoside 2-deoxyribosyltransferase
MKKVYICSSLREEPYKHVTEVLEKVTNPSIVVLRPNFGDENNKIAHVVQDVGMIRESDELWLMGEYGRDCSWEIGFAMALGIPVRIFIDETNRHLIEHDWMLLYGEAQSNIIYERVD